MYNKKRRNKLRPVGSKAGRQASVGHGCVTGFVYACPSSPFLSRSRCVMTTNERTKKRTKDAWAQGEGKGSVACWCDKAKGDGAMVMEAGDAIKGEEETTARDKHARIRHPQRRQDEDLFFGILFS